MTDNEQIPLCANHAESWFCERNHLRTEDCVVCEFEPPQSLLQQTALTLGPRKVVVDTYLEEIQKRGER